jgi:MFS family permease
MTYVPKLNFDEKKAKAYCLGVHLAGIRNFIGANAIITQGGILISQFNPGLGKWTSLILNVIQFLAIVFGMTVVQNYLGKKPLFLISIPVLSLLDYALVVAMIYQNVTAMLMLMCIYLAVFGTGFISPIWAYPSEVIPAAQQLPANILHWISIAISMLVPPLVASFMPNNNPWPVFIFFGTYGFIGFIHVRMTLR